MSTPAVSLLPHADYDNGATLERVRELLAPLGGMERFVRPGATVVLKPNLVYGRAADRAINTHPAVVRAAAILARGAGAGEILMGDSPGYGTALAAMKACGLAAVAEETGVRLVEFTPTGHTDGSRRFVRLELARELLDADVIINLPKMKTHGQMLMSLAVKNMFGAVPGARKLQWHYRAGRDRMLFARALNEIAGAVTPAVTILDAVAGMDGLGPTAGRARPVGFLAASDNMWSLDAAVMDILGVDRGELFTHAEMASRRPGVWEKPEISGPAPETLRPDDWRIPQLVTLQMHGGFVEKHLPFLSRWLRGKITPLPVANGSCRACGHCAAICPAQAIRIDNGKAAVDGALCIRCYCCHELCQFHGLGLETKSLLARLLRI